MNSEDLDRAYQQALDAVREAQTTLVDWQDLLAQAKYELDLARLDALAEPEFASLPNDRARDAWLKSKTLNEIRDIFNTEQSERTAQADYDDARRRLRYAEARYQWGVERR